MELVKERQNNLSYRSFGNVPSAGSFPRDALHFSYPLTWCRSLRNN